MTRAYDKEAERIGARSFTRPWYVKLGVFLVFLASVGVGAGLMTWLTR